LPSKPANRRVDHPAAPPEASSERVYEDSGYLWVDGSNSTDVSYHATGAYYQIYERLRARHPQLLLELCIEYYSARLGRGVLYAFRGSAPDQPAHRFRLHALTPGSRCALKFQDQGAAALRPARY